MSLTITEDEIYVSKNLIKTKEHLSPSGRFRLVVETYQTSPTTWNYTKGIIYSNNQWVGEIRRNYPHFPFLFFRKNNGTEYLISGRTYLSQTIINCETGHVYDNTDGETDHFCWSDIYQVNENTICVLGCVWGGSYFYQFYDMTNLNKGWPILHVNKELFGNPEYDYILTNQDLIGQNNYPKPVIQNGIITFYVKETRVKGLGRLCYKSLKENEIPIDVQDYVEMEVSSYIDQLYNDKFWVVENYKKHMKIYDMVEMQFKRVKDEMVMFRFWRSREQKQIDASI
jgi:hypothetical protein